MDGTRLVVEANRLEIRGLAADVLVLVFSLLPGQDIARCARVSGPVLPPSSGKLTGH